MFGYSIEQHRLPAKLRLNDYQIGPFQFSVHTGKHPARNRNLLARTPNVALALPKPIEGCWVAGGAIQHLQRSHLFRTIENFRSKTHNRLYHIAFRKRLRPHPPGPDGSECIECRLPIVFGRQLVEWFDRRMKHPTATKFFRRQIHTRTTRHPQLCQGTTFRECLGGPIHMPSR